MISDPTKGLMGLVKGINFNKILGGANKTLSFVKQAIPVYSQVRPMWGNIKTFLNMYGAVKTDKVPETDIKKTRPMPIKKNTNLNKNTSNRIDEYNDTLTFFQ